MAAAAIRHDGLSVSNVLTQEQLSRARLGVTTNNKNSLAGSITLDTMDVLRLNPWEAEQLRKLCTPYTSNYTRIYYNGKEIASTMPTRYAYRVTAVENGIEGKANTRQVIVIATDIEKAKLYAQYILQPDPATNVLFAEQLGPMPEYREDA